MKNHGKLWTCNKSIFMYFYLIWFAAKFNMSWAVWGGSELKYGWVGGWVMGSDILEGTTYVSFKKKTTTFVEK